MEIWVDREFLIAEMFDRRFCFVKVWVNVDYALLCHFECSALK